MPHPLAELRVDAVCKRFDGLVVFDRISFRLPPGETRDYVGPLAQRFIALAHGG